MEVHRSRFPLLMGVIFALTGLFILALYQTVGATLLALFALGLGGWSTYISVRPFKFHIGPDGLTVRLRKINRLVPWSEIHAVVLAAPEVADHRNASPRLLLVPASTAFEGKLAKRSPIDDRPAMELLDFRFIREPSPAVAEALARFGESRFIDARVKAMHAAVPQDFAMSLRGYEPAVVDALIQRAYQAIREDSAITRLTARAVLEGEIAKGLPVAVRGYDRQQVETALKRLLSEIAPI